MCRYDERFVDSHLHGDLRLFACCPDGAHCLHPVLSTSAMQVVVHIQRTGQLTHLFIKRRTSHSFTSSSSSKVMQL